MKPVSTVLACLLMTLTAVGADKRVVEGYPMSYERYQELRQALDGVASDKGTINYVKSAGKLLVVDVPKVHETVQKILAATHAPLVNVRIDVLFKNRKVLED